MNASVEYVCRILNEYLNKKIKINPSAFVNVIKNIKTEPIFFKFR